LPKVNINDLYKRRVKELVGEDTKELDRIEEEFNRKWTEEEWFQQIKKRWYFHELSWYMFEESERYTKKCDHPMAELSYTDNPYFCTPVHGCIEDCPFHAKEGKLEYSVIQQGIEGLNHFPHIKDARKILEEERAKAKRTNLAKLNKKVDNNPSFAIPPPELTEQQSKHPLFKLLKGQVFWIWDHRHLHLQEWLRTQGKCCFNHCIGEPIKWGAPMPIW
jgi:hypothetical protein